MNHQYTNPELDGDFDIAPRKIVLSDSKLTLTWRDKQATLDGAQLRAACRCAQCRMARFSKGVAIDVPLPTINAKLMGAVSMGYGLHLKFDDGHDRGIYPWAYLRGIANPFITHVQ